MKITVARPEEELVNTFCFKDNSVVGATLIYQCSLATLLIMLPAGASIELTQLVTNKGEGHSGAPRTFTLDGKEFSSLTALYKSLCLKLQLC